MPIKPRIEVEGAKQVRQQIRALDKRVANVKAANKTAATVVANQAMVEVPVRTGRLKRTIRPTASQTAGFVAAGWGGRVAYAGPIHFGWPSRPNREKGWRGGPIRPRPFIYNAIDKRIAEVVEAYEEYVNNAIKEAGLDYVNA